MWEAPRCCTCWHLVLIYEVRKPKNSHLNDIFSGNFTSVWCLHIIYIYRPKTTTKANKNVTAKPITNSLHAMQSMNKNERHEHAWALHQTPSLQFYLWHSPILIPMTILLKPLQMLHLLAIIKYLIFYSNCNTSLGS